LALQYESHGSTRNTSEHAELIEQLCRDLWQTATTRDTKWSAYFSAAESQLAADMSALPKRTGRPPSLRDAEQELERLRDLDSRLDAVNAVRHTRTLWLELTVTLLVALVLLIIASRIASLFTNSSPLTHGRWVRWRSQRLSCF
jgi:hypothetical protein